MNVDPVKKQTLLKAYRLFQSDLARVQHKHRMRIEALRAELDHKKIRDLKKHLGL